MVTNPRYRIIRIDQERGQPMQSAAKCPIMVTFICEKYEGPDTFFESQMTQKKQKLLKKSNYFQENFCQDDDENKEKNFLKYLLNPIPVKNFQLKNPFTRHNPIKQFDAESIFVENNNKYQNHQNPDTSEKYKLRNLNQGKSTENIILKTPNSKTKGVFNLMSSAKSENQINESEQSIIEMRGIAFNSELIQGTPDKK